MRRFGSKNRYALSFLIATAFMVGVIFFIIPGSYDVRFLTASSTVPAHKIPVVVSHDPEIVIGNTHIFVDVSTSSADVQKGLSGRPSLGENNGMLFIFSKPDIYHFWMPDMNFPLDMIWINNDKIVDISANVSNVFDPSAPVFYKPKVPAQYVIEVNANFSAQNEIHIGDKVTFKNIPLGNK